MSTFSLNDHQLGVAEVHHNLPPSLLAKAKTQRDPVFGFDAITECPDVPRGILLPRDAWADKTAYDAAAKKLAGLFRDNSKPTSRE